MTTVATGLEVRAAADGGHPQVTGYAAVWGAIAPTPQGYFERFESGSFDDVLNRSGTDVRALYEHRFDHLLGRQSADTLTLRADGHGLAFTLDMPDTTLGRDLAELVRRGDVNGASVGFVPGADRWDRLGGRSLRSHESVKALEELSLTSVAIYPDTTLAVRALTLTGVPDVTALERRTQALYARARAQGIIS